MGLLRVYLAICVISAHFSPALPWFVHDSRQAVQIFYIISGFYMALVLSQRYDTPRQFYLSRFLRIFSGYWVVLISICVASVAAKVAFDDWLYLKAFAAHPLERNGATGFFVALLSNLTLFGQDWVMFLQQDHGQAFGVAKNFKLNASPLFEYLVIPQCWSIGVELSFYLLVPYLNRLKTFDLALLVVSAISVQMLGRNYLGLTEDPWTYRFFPFELAWFLSGMLGYRIYVRFRSSFDDVELRVDGWRYAGAVGLLLVALYAHARIVNLLCGAIDYHRGVWLSYLVWPLLIAGLFRIFRNQVWDRFIGELSYPIYLVHVAVGRALRTMFDKLALPAEHLGKATAIASIGVALFLYLLCLKPIERKRHASVPSLSTLRAIERV